MKKMKRKMFLTFSLLVAMTLGLQAQTQTTLLKVTYVSGAETVTDELVFDGAEITILNNAIDIVSPLPESNKSYLFDNVRSLLFETSDVQGISEVKVSTFKAYKDGNVLRISASEPIKQFTVYAITGDAVYSGYTGNTEAAINISRLPQGVYLLQAGAAHVKFVK